MGQSMQGKTSAKKAPKATGDAGTQPVAWMNDQVANQKPTDPRPAKFSDKLMALAGDFLNALADGTSATWKAAKIAHHIRQQFPARAKAEDEGWTKFCVRALYRDYKTVNAYIRGYEYALQYEPERLANHPKALPPVSMVAALAGALPERRPELHARLFGLDNQGLPLYGCCDEFRDNLRTCKAPEQAVPSQNGGKKGEARKKKEGGAPPKINIQRVPTEKLATAIPSEYVYMVKAPDYSDATELAESVKAIVIAHYAKMSKEWSAILIPPCVEMAGKEGKA